MSNRKRILIDPEVQWSIGLRIMFHWVILLTCLVGIGVIVSLMFGDLEKSFVNAFWTALLSQRAVVVVMFVLIPVFIRDTLKLSNRFAGPMYRLKAGFKRVLAGEPHEDIKFRDGDFWSDAAIDFNSMSSELDLSLIHI